MHDVYVALHPRTNLGERLQSFGEGGGGNLFGVLGSETGESLFQFKRSIYLPRSTNLRGNTVVDSQDGIVYVALRLLL